MDGLVGKEDDLREGCEGWGSSPGWLKRNPFILFNYPEICFLRFKFFAICSWFLPRSPVVSCRPFPFAIYTKRMYLPDLVCCVAVCEFVQID